MSDTAARRVADGALAALAMHDTPSSVTALLSLARQGSTRTCAGRRCSGSRSGRRPGRTGHRRGPRAGSDIDVKRRAVFALSQLPAGEGIPRLIEVAGTHSSRAVRRQAMFWLGQSSDPRALAFFERILLK